METMTSNDYLTSEEVKEHSKSLQSEAMDDEENNAFLIHNIKLEIIRKTDIKTAKRNWTDEEKEQLKNVSRDFVEHFYDFLAKELKNNPSLGMLELKFATGDYKVAAQIESTKDMLKKMLSLDI